MKIMFGHSEKMNTMDVYVHDLEQSVEDMRKRIDRLMALANAIDESLTNKNCTNFCVVQMVSKRCPKVVVLEHFFVKIYIL